MQLKPGFITGGSCCQSQQPLLFILPLVLCAIAILSPVKAQQCKEGQYECPKSTTSSYTAALSNTTILSTTTTQLDTTNTTTPYTTPTPTTESGPCCMNCSENCKTCMGGSEDMCKSCEGKQVLVAEFCEDSLLQYCSSTVCIETCENETDICDCMLSSDSCTNMTDCLINIAGQCKKECDYDMKPKDFEFEGEKRTLCVKCDSSFLGFFCVERHLAWIVAAPIAIFVVLLVIIVACVCCCYCRRKGEVKEKRPSTTPVQDYPTEARRRQPSSFSTGEDRMDIGYNAQEVENQDDIYGNVDSQNNVMMQRAPSAEHEASIRRNIPHNFRQTAHAALAEQPEPGGELYGNEETLRMEEKVDYIHMNENVHVDRPRLPPNTPEPEDQPIYGNQQQPGISRHESVPVRLPPSIPQKKKASGTFPMGMEMPNFSGRINEGYEGEDNYPDFPPPSPPFDSIPSYPPPEPPSSGHSALKPPNQNKSHTKPWERTDAGSGGGAPVSELQKMFNKRNQQTEPETPDDMPSKAPPPVPGSNLSNLQQVLKTKLQKRESDRHTHPGIPAAPFKAGFSKAAESDSDEEADDNYEIVESNEDELSTRQPMPLPNARQDPAVKKPLPLPKNKKKKVAPPVVPVKPPPPEPQEVYEVMDTGDNDTRDRPRMPTPGEEEQEVYEAVDPSDQSGEVYEVTEVGTGAPPTTAGFQVEEDDIYQNAPAVKHGVKSGRYRNLPADRGQQPIKEGGYAKWQLK